MAVNRLQCLNYHQFLAHTWFGLKSWVGIDEFHSQSGHARSENETRLVLSLLPVSHTAPLTHPGCKGRRKQQGATLASLGPKYVTPPCAIVIVMHNSNKNNDRSNTSEHNLVLWTKLGLPLSAAIEGVVYTINMQSSPISPWP